MKQILTLGLKVMVLTFVMLIAFIVAALVTGAGGQAGPVEEESVSLLQLVVVCLLMTAALSYLIIRSRWSGLKLAVTVFVVFYGVMTLMSLIEALYFMTNIPGREMPRLFSMGAIVALIFSPVAVMVLGKSGKGGGPVVTEPNSRLAMPWTEWLWKVTVLAAAYLMLYFTFGYYVAWRHPEVREFYSGGPLIGFVPHMREVLTNTSLALFQALRGVLWVLLALPVIRMMKGHRWEVILGVAILFSVVHNAQLLLPNPYMPETVRMVHLAETASSMFIFGLLVGWLLSRRHSSY